MVEPLTVTPDNVAVIGKFATEQNIPVGGALIQAGEYSTIFGVNVIPFVSGKQAAPLADKILKGTPAGTIPVASAENFFQINYSAAQAAGVKVPEGLLSQADEVIR
jgi:putative ABC transport system substrate-binding protein